MSQLLMESTNGLPTLLKPAPCPEWKPVATPSSDDRGLPPQVSRSSRGWWWPWPKAETTHLSPGRRLGRKGLSFCRLPDECAPPRAAMHPLTHTPLEAGDAPWRFPHKRSGGDKNVPKLLVTILFCFLNSRTREAE